MITNSKDDCFAELGRKLSNPNNGPKTFGLLYIEL